MSENGDHRKKLADTYQRYRDDFSHFFHAVSQSADYTDRFSEKYPGIGYGNVVAALKNFETEDNKTNFVAIITGADTSMTDYAKDYLIDVTAGFCEMKYIYFTGLAFAQRLEEAAEQAEKSDIPQVRSSSLRYAATIIMCAMIANLDSLLLYRNIEKPELHKAMVRLVMNGKFEQEMGRTGCYLAYKSVSRMKS